MLRAKAQHALIATERIRRCEPARRLLREVAQLRLTADLPADADAETVYDSLRAMVNRAVRGPGESFESTAQLDDWYDQERALLVEGARIRAQSDAARRAQSAATDFARSGAIAPG